MWEKQQRQSSQGIERVEEQNKGEPEESVENGERASGESEGSDREREIPEGQKDLKKKREWGW